jgi:anti-anti-sigma regulatory factor
VLSSPARSVDRGSDSSFGSFAEKRLLALRDLHLTITRNAPIRSTLRPIRHERYLFGIRFCGIPVAVHPHRLRSGHQLARRVDCTPETRDDAAGSGANGVAHDHGCRATGRNRAGLRVVGRLDTGTAPVLACVTDGHLRADRRYLRMNVSRVCSVDEEAIDVLHELHRQLLARRGTLIITGVGVSLEAALTRLSGELFLLAPTAADPID